MPHAMPFLPPLRAPLRSPLDQCLTSDEVRVAAIRTGPHVGSDHRPVVVDVLIEESGVREGAGI